jgi:hypothetical protein
VFRWQGEDRLRDLVAIEPLVVLNAGFCERHMRHCPRSPQLLSECAKVRPWGSPPGPPLGPPRGNFAWVIIGHSNATGDESCDTG